MTFEEWFNEEGGYDGSFDTVESASEAAWDAATKNELLARRSELHEHIENLKKASQDYCMCGEPISKHGVNGDHAPISEFSWYIERHEL